MSANHDINYATIAAFKRASEPESKRSPMRVLSLLLLAVFFIVLMVGLASSVQIYHQVARVQQQTNEMHVQSGLVSNTVHMNDFAGAVSSATGPEGQALVLSETIGDNTYETRLYLYKRHLVQEYAIAGRDFNPEGARELLETSTFEFEYADGLLTIVTDDGETVVAVRSEQDASEMMDDSLSRVTFASLSTRLSASDAPGSADALRGVPTEASSEDSGSEQGGAR